MERKIFKEGTYFTKFLTHSLAENLTNLTEFASGISLASVNFCYTQMKLLSRRIRDREKFTDRRRTVSDVILQLRFLTQVRYDKMTERGKHKPKRMPNHCMVGLCIKHDA